MHDIPGTSPEIPDQTSALVLVENLLHPSLFFLWHFDNSCGSLLYTLDLRLQRVLVWWPHLSRVPHLGLHQKQVERPPHIDVRYERAGPLQRSKELVGLGDDSIMCVSSLRSRRLEVFGWKKEQARESETRAPPSFLAPPSSRLVRVPGEGARGGDSEIFVLSTSFKVHAIKVYDTSFINKTRVLFCHKTK